MLLNSPDTSQSVDFAKAPNIDCIAHCLRWAGKIGNPFDNYVLGGQNASDRNVGSHPLENGGFPNVSSSLPSLPLPSTSPSSTSTTASLACGAVNVNVNANTCVNGYQETEGIPLFLFYIIGSIMLVVFVLGFSENAIVVYVYVRNRKLQTVSNVFILGLSISDIGQAMFNIPLVVISNFSGGWYFGEGVCMYYGFVTTTFGLAQISLLTVIALERYCIIVHHARVFSGSMRKAVAAIALCFGYGCAWALGPLFGWSEYRVEKFGTRCAVSWEIKNGTYLSYTLCLFTFVWFIPLFLITFGYTSIACMIYREKSTKRTIRTSNERKSTKERKVAITVLFMIGAFVISWLPYSAVALYTVIFGTSDLSFVATLVPALIAKSSIIWNPIIYVVRHRDFRRACLKTLRLCLLCNHHQHNDHLVKTDCPKWGSQGQENRETAQRLLKQSTSASFSECSSSRESHAGTRISALTFDSFDAIGREKMPKLTSKDGWKHSPHPSIRRSQEERRIVIPSLDPSLPSPSTPSGRTADRITNPVIRRALLRAIGTSTALATVVDIECESSGQDYTQYADRSATSGTGSCDPVDVGDVMEKQSASSLSPILRMQPRLIKVRRHQSLGDSVHRGLYSGVRETYGASIGDASGGGVSTKGIKAEPTMFDTRRDDVIFPYKRRSRSKMEVVGRRHLSDSSTTINKQLKYNKCDAKQKRYIMRNRGVQQKIEMSVLGREASSVFSRDADAVNEDPIHSRQQQQQQQSNDNEEALDGMQGLQLLSNEDEDQETFESHIGACSMIRQSTV